MPNEPFVVLRYLLLLIEQNILNYIGRNYITYFLY